MNSLAVRGFVSTSLLLLFVLLLATGALLYLDATIEGHWILDKHALKEVHTYAGFLMAAFVFVHLWLNRKAFLTEIKL